MIQLMAKAVADSFEHLNLSSQKLDSLFMLHTYDCTFLGVGCIFNFFPLIFHILLTLVLQPASIALKM